MQEVKEILVEDLMTTQGTTETLDEHMTIAPLVHETDRTIITDQEIQLEPILAEAKAPITPDPIHIEVDPGHQVAVAQDHQAIPVLVPHLASQNRVVHQEVVVQNGITST